MTPSICVFGLWHLGTVTAACLAAEGLRVVGLDREAARVAALRDGKPPVSEPGLAELVVAGVEHGSLRFTEDPAQALGQSDILWVTFDTPVDDEDRADVDWVRAQLDEVRPHLRPGALVLVSSQVPVGFTAALQRAWRSSDSSLQFAVSPENLRLGQAIDAFRDPARVVVGLGEHAERFRIARLFAPFTDRIEWMSLESAEMAKHALNAFLAISAAYANEVGRLCERVGADARDVERALKSEPRIGSRAYLAPGPPIAGGTLLRDVSFLGQLAGEVGVGVPLIDAVPTTNRLHLGWARDQVKELVAGVEEPVVALLGLTYKPGTDTLRRSAAVDLARWLLEEGVRPRAFDPMVASLPAELQAVELTSEVDAALAGADVAVVATPWPIFRELTADRFVRLMRRPQVVDQAGFLGALSDAPDILYLRVGSPRTPERCAE
jgi:UDPglucose 6-dehydrogenase